jgi:SAM-dependent methyltransferase
MTAFESEGGTAFQQKSDEATEIKRMTERSFGYEWVKYSKLVDLYETWFLRWIAPLEPPFFKGKLVLDAGCGMGRHMYCASKYGAKIVGIDLSNAIFSARDNLRHRQDTYLIQCDIYYPPLRPHFDFIYSIGVIHHLPDPKEGIMALKSLLKSGGRMLVWVYAKEGNELIELIEPLRRIAIRLPLHTLETLAGLLAIPLFGLSQVCRMLQSISCLNHFPYFQYLVRLGEFKRGNFVLFLFDILSAPRTTYISSDQLRSWFVSAGFEINVLRWLNRNGWTIIGTKR